MENKVDFDSLLEESLKESSTSLLVEKGAVVAAEYLPPELPKFKGNPLIQALPPINTRKRAAELMQRQLKATNEQRKLPNELRFHLVMDLLHFFQPLPIHQRLEQMISRVIRDGYLSRNPMNLGFSGNLQQRLEYFKNRRSFDVEFESTAAGFSIAGMSGVGKTTAIRKVLSLYPQIVVHNHYNDQKFTKIQVVWLRLQCPKDGSVRALCMSFFAVLDGILDTNYAKTYGNARNANELVVNMAIVAANLHLGILVIDEIQNLSQAKSGGAEEMLNFFVQLINEIGLPVVLIGTYKAVPILSCEFRQARRNSGQGDLVWDRMGFGKDWKLFTETLWRVQYVRKPCLLTTKLSKALHDVSYGITDLAIRIYMAAQWRAIDTGCEKITENLLRSAYRDHFRLVNRILETLKSGEDPELLEHLQDVCPPPLLSIIKGPEQTTSDGESAKNEESGRTETQGVQGKDTGSPETPTSAKYVPSNKSQNNLTHTTSKPRNPRKKKSNATQFESDDLRGIVKRGQEINPPVSAYQSLLEKGCIRSANEYIQGEVA